VNFKYIPAKVLNNSIDQKVNYITLNVGSKHGIKKNMSVINDKGIVGKISHVSENYSVAISVLSEHFNVSAMLSDGTVGKVAWDGKDPEFVMLNGIPQSVKVKPLDSVFTSGYSIFPEKILIGRAAKSNNGTSYKIWLSTKFTKLHYVYVIEETTTNIERIQLEETVQEEHL
jgi:rod shape-determining protein MreC